MSKRIRPEVATLPDEHVVVKVDEVPSGLSVMRINAPFTITQLSRCFDTAFLQAQTGKSVMTLLGKDSAKIKQYIKEMENMIVEKYPMLRKKLLISVAARIAIGSVGGGKQNRGLKFVADLKKLVETFEECGFSDIPMKAFQVPIQTSKGNTEWATFYRRGDMDGFVLASVGSKTYLNLKKEELRELIQNNVGLLKAKAHICETKVHTGKWMSCEV